MTEAQTLTQTTGNNAGLSSEAIAELNAAYAPLDFEARIRRLYEDFAPDKVMVTSSFAATSAYFLHIISRIRPQQTVFFINTGFHFKETLEYRDYLTELYGLKVEDINPDPHHLRYSQEERLYKKDPDLCCSVNKVQPLEEVKDNYHVWVSSLMRWQTEHRAGLEIFEERRGIIKFNPMIDVTQEERDAYIREHQLPFHPLVSQGYGSIGCLHCTVKGDERSGRWQGKAKTECGLHL
ncbi:phosphoadenosine phosphosulfate reductase [Alkalilimnicola ehrlichii]|uniref:Adenosine 5'-phosphosulfate reductase n=1 Tax=Alkalilimnicola ehrlichii TaxID=351052 RepID=A0A3E0WV70_9GAMM|nr:phosphoadenylyl-sulfate reductase [Alkalilimnicola ehrlichii]RFA29160.1 phosphoadenosine phosphosulfate reductase [Alkalilimnicola ehrlichii]RFA36073.1 phosphoadenosine phosphosulfate reductase [Alkalilimnicola ehrlichii]